MQGWVSSARGTWKVGNPLAFQAAARRVGRAGVSVQSLRFLVKSLRMNSVFCYCGRYPLCGIVREKAKSFHVPFATFGGKAPSWKPTRKVNEAS